ncbi:adenylate/guanylate cyclase domain-containing protein [Oscillatoria sp. FACHB-1406]|uniref:adenylate/guanylate cyclase domain-containing protein n=1 Tax=Oscillatoria sp. FACHB-1406 TaxID=2692846 RepID=UPI0032203E1C
MRGILEIIQPLDGIVTQTRSQLKNTSLILGSVSMLAVVGIVLVLGRLQQTSKELELRVIERTAQLQQSNQELAQEREKSERLLLNILPPAIAAQLKEGEGNIARGFSEVTILFADITNFTSLSEQMSPIVLVRLLNEVFSAFDRLTEQHGIEKIKTIGDAYMAVGGLPIPRRDHAEAIAEMALDMQEAIAQFQKHPEWRTIDLQIRIGINTGAVVAGTIGLKKFTYDLWGDAVNVASRMESSSIPGQIQVAEATYKRLKDKYYFEERDEILIKGKGKMKTYWLKGRLNN